MVLDQILQIRITEEERRALEEIAEIDERSLSFVIRQAIRHEIERHRAKKTPRGGQATLIREVCRNQYIEPARARGAKTVTIRIGTLARELGLESQPAAVIGAIGADKFLKLCNIERAGVKGPATGMTTEYTFILK